LKSLILDNFKSFANRTQIDLLEGFTAISGPNGSGKSNLIDAVLFVLGFASSKGLRADRLTDLINSDSGKPQARVTLELEVLTDDDEVKLVQVSRVVRRVRQNESQAHYELDGAPVRLHDLHDVLHDLGLPSSGLNVVVQNDVTRVTGMGEIERRKILDELAGAEEFDRRIKAADGELQQAAAHENETRIVLGEIETRLASLEKERDQALAYQALQVERDRSEAELFVLDVLEAIHKAEKKREEVATRIETAANLAEDLGEARSESEKADLALAAVEAEIAAKGEGERLTALRETEALRAHVADKRSRADEARHEADAIRARDPERDAALETALHKEQEFARREAERKRELEALEDRHGALRREVDLGSAQAQKQAKGAFEAFEQQRTLQREVEALRSRDAAQASSRRDLSERTVRASTERDGLRATIESDRARRSEVEAISAEAQSERRIAMQDEAREGERVRKLLQRSLQLRSGLDKAEADLAQGMSDLGRIEERRRVAIDQSGGRGMEALRREGVRGVHGAVHELLKFEPDHALAIEAAAGMRLWHVVVDDEHVGKRGIEVLKRTNAGQLTFAPLSKIRPPEVKLRPVRGRGVLGYALELVEFEPVYEPVMRLVFSDTLIVDTLEAAIQLGIASYRMVTLDGELLDRNGTMRGGSASSRGTVLAAAARFEQEVAQKEAGLGEVRRRRDAARAELEKVDNEGRLAQASHASCQARLAEATKKVELVHEELVRLEARIAPAETRFAALEAELARANSDAAAAEADLARLRETVAAAEARLFAVPEAGTEAFEDFAAKQAALEQSVRDLEAQVRDAREEVASVQLQRQKAAVEVEGARSALEVARRSWEAANERAEAASSEAARLEADLAQKEKLVATLVAELEELTQRRNDAKVVAQDARDQAKEVERLLEFEKQALASAQQALGELEAIARGLETQAAEKKIALPPLVEAKPANEEAPKPRRRRARAVGGVPAEPLPAEVVDPSAPAPASGPAPVNPADLGRLRDHARRELARLEGKMRALEPVNMMAIAQHAEFSARKAELDEKLATLDREMSAIRSKIVELDGAKRTTFLEKFEIVAAGFAENFHELLGGEGRLELEKPESPFEGGLAIIAKPDGQKARRLEALSGGQKTLTALAFLFALQRVTPAPFFVLDEVDASLDGANTSKLADAIRRRGAERQYFVVSHRRALVEKAQRAIGVIRRPGYGTQVAGITLDDVSAFEAAAARDAARRPSGRTAASRGESRN
jgi:chromosome segregation protein